MTKSLLANVPGVLRWAHDRRRLYTANSNDVARVDTSSLTVIKTVPVGSSPRGCAVGREATSLA
jgi:YVTN family beta-propeller protein